MAMGEEGYIKSCKEIVGAARKLVRRLGEEVPEVQILGDPQVSVVAFSSNVVDILEIGDRLSKKGWHCIYHGLIACYKKLIYLIACSERVTKSFSPSYLRDNTNDTSH